MMYKFWGTNRRSPLPWGLPSLYNHESRYWVRDRCHSYWDLGFWGLCKITILSKKHQAKPCTCVDPILDRMSSTLMAAASARFLRQSACNSLSSASGSRVLNNGLYLQKHMDGITHIWDGGGGGGCKDTGNAGSVEDISRNTMHKLDFIKLK